MVYDVISLENIGDGHGGYEVNDAHYTGQQVTLEAPTLINAVQALKQMGCFSKRLQTRWVRFYEEDNGGSLTLCQKKTGKFLYELRPQRPHTGGQ